MTNDTERVPLGLRLEGLAMQMADAAIQTNDPALQDYALTVSELAQQHREEYVRIHGGNGREVPTYAQGIALARFLRRGFSDEVHAGDRHAHVARGGAGLSDDYLYVRLADGYEGGIDRDGAVST